MLAFLSAFVLPPECRLRVGVEEENGNPDDCPVAWTVVVEVLALALRSAELCGCRGEPIGGA